MAYGGALQEMDSMHLLDDLERVGGTSVGAIQAALIAVGYTPTELIKIIGDSKFSKFSDGHGIFIGGTHRMRRYYGWYRGDRFNAWMGALIEAKTGNADLTFAELQNLKVDHSNILDLYVTATNLSMQRVEVLSYERFPNMKIRLLNRLFSVFSVNYGHLSDQTYHARCRRKSCIRTRRFERFAEL